jgi:carbon starvation protein
MMIFIWITLTYVIVAFTDITAASFVGVSEELSISPLDFNPGGAVALAAFGYLIIAMIMGIVEQFFKPKTLVLTIIFLPLTFSFIWLSTKYSALLNFDLKTWSVIILLYCFLASLLPVWLLLKPRGYLGGFILYFSLMIGLVGLFCGDYEIKQPAIKPFDFALTSSLFPFLFVTIACGACSGFHGLVCSGTTAKQIERESDITAIGYGAMLCEAVVAFIALACVMIFSSQEIANLKPGGIFGKGIGEFLGILVGPKHKEFATTFGAMAFSTFVFDTLDVATRLGRYLLQELLHLQGKVGALLATVFTIVIPLFLMFNAGPSSYMQFWTLFGASNQLLAALTLLVITVWLYENKTPIVFTLLPTIFVFLITISALFMLAYDSFINNGGSILRIANGLIALCLVALAFYFIKSSINKVVKKASYINI